MNLAIGHNSNYTVEALLLPMGVRNDRIYPVKNEKKHRLPGAAVPVFLIILYAAVFFCGCKNAGNFFDGISMESRAVSEESVPGRFNASDPYYIMGEKRQREVLRDLFSLLEAGGESEGTRFPIVQEIAFEYAREKEYGRLVNFLNSWIHERPDDPYAAYYYLLIAFAYIQQEAYPVATIYFDMIVKNHPDLTIQGESIHFIALNRLIALASGPEQMVWYYETLISRFPGKTDLGAAYFMLGRSYEQTGNWNGAIQSYTKFLPYYGTVIPGFPNAYTYAKQLVDFNNSPKDWTFESLEALLEAISSALDTGNSFRLIQCRAKVNFFARSWEQEDEDNAGMAEFNLSDFMRGNRIRHTAALDSASNANEAFLRTWGWSQYISVWYFYFRKINFPLNPEIHGRWEWAGIYYGEKF
ncbi:MAG: tetratricopeptide repeat protein [Treponema sp.]|jgi:tetratricopeptide (TPR) repeat protein|nr:tetratricopeptide repeat protein [Treponema sp.]